MSDRALLRLGQLAVVLAGALAVAVLATVPGDPEFGYDLDAYLGAADNLMAGLPYYPVPDATGGITLGPAGIYPYPPVWTAAFVPLALLPREAVHAAWFVGLIVLAAAVGVALVRPLPVERRYWAAAAYLAYLPLLSEIRFGNLNLITLALVLLAWNQRRRPALAGVLFAVAIGLKLLPLALLAFLFIGGRWRVGAWAVGAFTLVVVFTWPWMGGAWIEYLGVLRAIGTGIPGAGSNIVPDEIIVTPLRYIGPFVAVGVAALAGWGVRRHGRERLGFAVALAMAPFVGTSVWYPYLVLALPLILGSDGGRPRPDEQERTPLVPRLVGWLAIEARLDPLPLVGLLLASISGLYALFRGERTEPVGERLAPVGGPASAEASGIEPT
ncbi:MAG: glycosyltransferase family 87 protein [Candidatus Limnocylindrales bacterium]